MSVQTRERKICMQDVNTWGKCEQLSPPRALRGKLSEWKEEGVGRGGGSLHASFFLPSFVRSLWLLGRDTLETQSLLPLPLPVLTRVRIRTVKGGREGGGRGGCVCVVVVVGSLLSFWSRREPFMCQPLHLTERIRQPA